VQTWLEWAADDQAERQDRSADFKAEDEDWQDEEEAHLIVRTDPCQALQDILDRVSCSSKVTRCAFQSLPGHNKSDTDQMHTCRTATLSRCCTFGSKLHRKSLSWSCDYSFSNYILSIYTQRAWTALKQLYAGHAQPMTCCSASCRRQRFS
jgi:hypothetical protein